MFSDTLALLCDRCVQVPATVRYRFASVYLVSCAYIMQCLCLEAESHHELCTGKRSRRGGSKRGDAQQRAFLYYQQNKQE